MDTTQTDVAHAWYDELGAMGACEEAYTYARGYASFAEAWAACPRGDWLLWYLAKRGPRTNNAAKAYTRIAIRAVFAISNRKPIPVFDEWAEAYLQGIGEDDKTAAEAAEAAAAARAARAAVWAEAAAWAAEAAAKAAWAAGAGVLEQACALWVDAARETEGL